MARSTIPLLFCLILFTNFVSSNLVRSDINTKEVPVLQEEGSEQTDGTTAPSSDVTPAQTQDVDTNDIVLDNREAETPITKKPCAKIGEYCISHTDCCTNSCLGYMRRCVS